ncbi:MAG: EAL domain-containing protein [Kangiellaceae bacterium]|nr:EAL domain-containing protein [Kangiellaceae bacterium]
MNSKGNKNPINTLIISNSANDSEQIASHLKNQGLAIRHTVISNSEQLKEAVDEKQWQQALFLNELDNLTVQQALAMLKTQTIAVPTIMLSESYSEEFRFDCLAKGVKDCIPSTALDLLTFVVKREQLLVQAQQELTSASKLVSETSKRNELLLDSSKDAIAYIHEGMHIYTNPTYFERFGYDEDEIIVMTIMDMIAAEDTQKVKDLLKEQAQTGEEVSQIMRGKTADGETFEANFIVSSAIYDDEHCVQLLVREVADNAELMQKLKEASEIDQITGIYNRPAFMDRLEKAVEKSRETGLDAYLNFIEIDKFKDYRSEFGLAACDELLKGVADWLKATCDNQFTAARISDSSFAVLIPQTDSLPSEFAKKLLASIEQQMFEISGQTKRITVSIGTVTCTDNDLTPSKLMAHATSVAHKVQDNGGNDYKVFNPSIDSLLSDEDKAVYDEFVEAREAGHMTLFYQPMMSLKGNPSQQYMCYLRYQKKDGSWGLAPSIFSVMERLGIDAEIDKITLKHSLKVLMKEKAEGKSTRLFLTLNPNTLLNDDLPQLLEASIAKSGIDKEKLVFTINIQNVATYQKRVLELREAFNERGLLLCISGVDIEHNELMGAMKSDYVTFAGSLLETLKTQGPEKVVPLVNITTQSGAKTIITQMEDASALAQIWPLGIDFAMGNYVSKPVSKLNYDFAASDF